MKKLFLLVSVSLALAVVFLGLSQMQKKVVPISASVIQGGSDILDFNLLDVDGKPFTKASLAGKWTVLYLGFTQCPDACPTAMGYFKGELNKIPSEAAKDLNFVMVTVDPDRDTPAILKSYTSAFHTDLNAATGDIEEIKKLAKSLHTHFHKEEIVSDDLYMMAHSPRYYLVSPEARLYATYEPPVAAGQLAKDLQQLAEESHRKFSIF